MQPCQPTCFFQCCFACEQTPVMKEACAAQREVLTQPGARALLSAAHLSSLTGRQPPPGLPPLLPVENRTMSAVVWCAARPLPSPAPEWTRRSRTAKCRSQAASMGNSSNWLRKDVTKMMRLLELTRFFDGPGRQALDLFNEKERESARGKPSSKPAKQSAGLNRTT